MLKEILESMEGKKRCKFLSGFFDRLPLFVKNIKKNCNVDILKEKDSVLTKKELECIEKTMLQSIDFKKIEGYECRKDIEMWLVKNRLELFNLPEKFKEIILYIFEVHIIK